MKVCPKCWISHSKNWKFCSRSCANSRTYTKEQCIQKSRTVKRTLELKVRKKLSKAIITEKICPKCWISHTKEWSFCSRVCANSRVWTEEQRERKWRTLKLTLVEKSNTIKVSFIDVYKKLLLKCLDQKFFCKVCWKYTKGNVTCSKFCQNELRSRDRSEYLLENWINNFSTKRELLQYKWIEIECDSKLEQAGIIYLLDIFWATKIERYKSILMFEDEFWVKRRFNPDFWVEKEWEIYIVEVKMLWSQTNEHIYNKYIPQKKKRLEEFCKEKWYRSLWLDFNYDSKFTKIYNSL